MRNAILCLMCMIILTKPLHSQLQLDLHASDDLNPQLRLISLTGEANTIGTLNDGDFIVRMNGTTQEALRIRDDNLYLGIGTASPQARVEIEGTGNVQLLLDGDNSGLSGLKIDNGGGIHSIYDDFLDNNNLIISSANDIGFITDASSSTAVLLNTQGNLGIGTGNSILSRLDVKSNESSVLTLRTSVANATIDFYKNNEISGNEHTYISNTGNFMRIGSQRPGGNMDWWMTDLEGTTRSVMHLDGDKGRLGIGTDSPSYKLHVKVTGNDGIYTEGDGLNDLYALRIFNYGGVHMIYDEIAWNNALVFETDNFMTFRTDGGFDRMIIEETGEIEINYNNPTLSQLYVRSSVKSTGLTGVNFKGGTGDTYGVVGTDAGTGTGDRYGVFGIVTGSGDHKYGVYGSSPEETNSWAVYANGNIWWSGSQLNPSDRKLKRDIQNLDSVLDKVIQLEPARFKFRKDEFTPFNLPGGYHYGFVAQDVAPLFPELVRMTSHSALSPDDYQAFGLEVTSNRNNEILGLNSMEMIPILVKAIQEQQEIIESLKARIDHLEALHRE